MSDTSLDFLIEQIKNRKVEPPMLLTAHELSMWMLGYSACQSDITDVISKMKEIVGSGN